MEPVLPKCQRLARSPRVIVGGVQFTPEDPWPTPIVALSYDSQEEAHLAGQMLLGVQNGTRPLKIGRPVYMGDTAIRVTFSKATGEGRSRQIKPPDPCEPSVLASVYAYGDSRHLTCAVYAASRITLEQLKVFRNLMELNRNYHFTVAHQDNLLLEALDVVKYTILCKGV